jgi:diguanylate cyclase (GGDEF)-like protein/PAS domain S-box-containing protein
MKNKSATVTAIKAKRKMKLKCWECYQCHERDCPVLKSKKSVRCWLISGTHCRNEIQGRFIEKAEMCLKCKIFKANMDIPSMAKTMTVLSQQFEEYRQELETRDRELETTSMDLSIGLSETFEALKRIAAGDPSIRIPEQSNIELLTRLKYLVNLTAQEIGEIVQQSHEFAIDLAEHFDVLHRVSKGDLTARISEKSNTEISRALKTVTNDMITNIQKAEKALIESEKKYSTIVENSNDGIVILQDGLLKYANSKMLEITQYSKEETIGRAFIDFISPGYKGFVIDRYKRRMAGQEVPNNYEIEIISRKGKTIPVEINASCIKYEGKLADMAIVRDITERKRAEEALRESEEKYSSLFQHSNDAIFLHELNGHILDVNQKVLDQFQYTKSEILSLKIADLHPDESLPMSKRAFRKVIENGFFNFEIDFKKKNGEPFPAEVSSSIFKIGAKEVIQGIVRDITDRKKAIEQIAHMAYHDPLTNLPNRHLLKDRLQQTLAAAKHHNRIVAILFLDLDNFKRINDTLGHDEGDKLLQNVADRLRGYIRNSDSIARLEVDRGDTTVARLGGDEFTILLTEIKHIRDATKVAQRILDLFNEPFVVESHEVFITTSIGISVYPDDGDTVDTLLKHADTAMYHAKEQGRNNYQFYKESMNITTIERLDLENRLRKALDKREFVVHYQPQLDTRTKQITAVEALVRWMHPDKGMMLPMTFIPVAEETGLIIPIGEWIVRTACKQNKAWQQAGLPPIRVTVNISGVQFNQKNFVKMVAKVLKESGLDPQYLELELTETILMQTTDTAVTTLKELKSLGIRLSIDDFGTGYCSLNYLKSFPIDTLKIDQSFVRDLSVSQENKAIIHAIIALGHSLNLHVIAEGVETMQQLEYLSEKESDAVQGFLFSRPLPNDVFKEFFNEKIS